MPRIRKLLSGNKSGKLQRCLSILQSGASGECLAGELGCCGDSCCSSAVVSRALAEYCQHSDTARDTFTAAKGIDAMQVALSRGSPAVATAAARVLGALCGSPHGLRCLLQWQRSTGRDVLALLARGAGGTDLPPDLRAECVDALRAALGCLHGPAAGGGLELASLLAKQAGQAVPFPPAIALQRPVGPNPPPPPDYDPSLHTGDGGSVAGCAAVRGVPGGMKYPRWQGGVASEKGFASWALSQDSESGVSGPAGGDLLTAVALPALLSANAHLRVAAAKLVAAAAAEGLLPEGSAGVLANALRVDLGPVRPGSGMQRTPGVSNDGDSSGLLYKHGSGDLESHSRPMAACRGVRLLALCDLIVGLMAAEGQAGVALLTALRGHEALLVLCGDALTQQLGGSSGSSEEPGPGFGLADRDTLVDAALVCLREWPRRLDSPGGQNWGTGDSMEEEEGAAAAPPQACLFAERLSGLAEDLLLLGPRESAGTCEAAAWSLGVAEGGQDRTSLVATATALAGALAAWPQVVLKKPAVAASCGVLLRRLCDTAARLLTRHGICPGGRRPDALDPRRACTWDQQRPASPGALWGEGREASHPPCATAGTAREQEAPSARGFHAGVISPEPGEGCTAVVAAMVRLYGALYGRRFAHDRGDDAQDGGPGTALAHDGGGESADVVDIRDGVAGWVEALVRAVLASAWRPERVAQWVGAPLAVLADTHTGALAALTVPSALDLAAGLVTATTAAAATPPASASPAAAAAAAADAMQVTGCGDAGSDEAVARSAVGQGPYNSAGMQPCYGGGSGGHHSVRSLALGAAAVVARLLADGEHAAGPGSSRGTAGGASVHAGAWHGVNQAGSWSFGGGSSQPGQWNGGAAGGASSAHSIWARPTMQYHPQGFGLLGFAAAAGPNGVHRSQALLSLEALGADERAALASALSVWTQLMAQFGVCSCAGCPGSEVSASDCAALGEAARTQRCGAGACHEGPLRSFRLSNMSCSCCENCAACGMRPVGPLLLVLQTAERVLLDSGMLTAPARPSAAASPFADETSFAPELYARRGAQDTFGHGLGQRTDAGGRSGSWTGWHTDDGLWRMGSYDSAPRGAAIAAVTAAGGNTLGVPQLASPIETQLLPAFVDAIDTASKITAYGAADGPAPTAASAGPTGDEPAGEVPCQRPRCWCLQLPRLRARVQAVLQLSGRGHGSSCPLMTSYGTGGDGMQGSKGGGITGAGVAREKAGSVAGVAADLEDADSILDDCLRCIDAVNAF